MRRRPLAYHSETLALGDLLSGARTYDIPLFQRSYSWTAREVGQLLTDLWFGVEEAHKKGEDYGGLYLGSLVVVDPVLAGQGNQADPYQVIDGKQRLTTLSILLSALRDRLGADAAWIDDQLSHVANPGEDAPRTSRLALGIEEGAYYNVQVLRPGATRSPLEPDGEHLGRRGIRECQLTILDDFEERDDAELAELAGFLRDNVVLAMIAAPDMDSAFRVFLSTNHRGKPLSATDILKAELMAEVGEREREGTLERWRTAEKLLGDDFGQLPAYLHALHGRSHGAHIREVLELSRQQGGAGRFLGETLFPMAEQLYPILNATHMGSPHSEAINRSLRMLGWQKAHDWVPPVLAFAARHPDEPELMAVFLEAHERLAFTMQISSVGGEQRARRYRAVMDWLDENQAPGYASGPIALTSEDQGALLLKANGSLHKRSAATCKYLLKRISATFPGDMLVASLTDVSVEHVLPTSPAQNSSWLRDFPDASERVACNKLLGNLVLATRQQNTEARNQGLEAKQRILFPGGQASPHAITNMLMGISAWTAGDIRARDALFTERLREIAGVAKEAAPARRKKARRAG